jgi:hypothetical protein
MRLLVLYHAGYSYTPTIRHYLEAFGRYSTCEVAYSNVDQPECIDLAYFDAVLVNFCVTSMVRFPERLPEFFPPLAAALAGFKGVKLAAVQDDYDFTNRVIEFLAQIGADIVLTPVPAEGIPVVYRELANRMHFETVRTAYLVPGLIERGHSLPPLAERPISLGYRGRELPYRLGDLAWHKAEVGRQFKWACSRRHVACDIAIDEGSRFLGDAWLDFVARCRVMLGSPSGANVFDFDGSLHKRLVALYRPGLRYGEVRDEILAHAVPFDMGQVSARIYEAVAFGTALALVRGNYSGVLEPDEHYVPIEPDYSNVDQVLERILDIPAMEAMAERALTHVTGDLRNHYSDFVGRIDDLILARCHLGGGVAHGQGPRPAVTDHLLGTDPYLIRQLFETRRALAESEANRREFLQLAAERRLEVVRTGERTYQVLHRAEARSP